ncbi:outer membrane beta-barrel protein [uncultured Algibacter sp.]|uniref:outer membrane beta-barrel protein n=1 Tax=uncultured Algibacter sp. TaxID=298659 RepID=UPI00262B20E5|nr:outer membrane beta-barrel protein [uncultured Algibacter sp.]
MNDKKHIDRLFQENFKDFEATPNDAVWKNIESKLTEKKKKRRVIPIWWRYAGVAALLLLLITVGGIYFNNTDENITNQVVDTENTNPENNKVEEISNPLNEGEETNIIAIDNDSQDSSDNTTEASKIQSEIITNKINPSKESSIAETSSSKNKNKSKTDLITTNKSNNNKKIVSPKNNNVIANSLEEKNSTKNSQKEEKNNIVIANTTEEKDKSVDIKKEAQIVNKEEAKKLILETSKDNTAIANSNNKNTEENKQSIEDALNQDVIEDDKSNNINNRWSVTPNAAPVYFNTLGEGSSIDPQFSSNSKSGEVNMSYGISASYAINKKLSVRSGINRVNLGYNTNDVVVFQSVGLSSRSSALQNVNSGSNSSSDAVSLISSETLNTSQAFESSNASINQAFGYIEIPLEIQYTLSDKKFGVNLIGGFSSFFLNNNEIYSEEDNGRRTFLGEANNINKTSYSANFGLGLNYKVSKKFDLNLEPIFKYQFNTFNNTSGNFSPYFIGVYSGFSIKF